MEKGALDEVVGLFSGILKGKLCQRGKKKETDVITTVSFSKWPTGDHLDDQVGGDGVLVSPTRFMSLENYFNNKQ
jgi:hypothetical protein